MTIVPRFEHWRPQVSPDHDQALRSFKRETMSDKPGNLNGMTRTFIPPSYSHHHGYPARIFPRSTSQPWPADPAASHRSLGTAIIQHLPKSRVLHHAAGTQPNTRYRAENPVVSHVPLPTEAAAALSNHITRMQPIEGQLLCCFQRHNKDAKPQLRITLGRTAVPENSVTSWMARLKAGDVCVACLAWVGLG